MSSSTRQMSAIVEVGRNSLAFAKFTAFIRFRIENCWFMLRRDGQVMALEELDYMAVYLNYTRLGKLIVFCSTLARNPCSNGHHHLQDLVASPSLGEQSLCELKHSGQSFARDRVD